MNSEHSSFAPHREYAEQLRRSMGGRSQIPKAPSSEEKVRQQTRKLDKKYNTTSETND